MPKIEYLRDPMSVSPTLEYFIQKAQAGWKLVAVEWERASEGEPEAPSPFTEDVPYGLQVSEDCLHLVENPGEKRVLTLVMQLLFQDLTFSRVAEELNQLGHRTREGAKWTTVSIFRMLPRLVEVGPRILASKEWAERRKHLLTVTWDS
jgi:hypothetical protein